MPNLFKLLIVVLISLFFVNTYSSNVVSDSIKIDQFKKHVKSLDYISRKTSNNKLYLNLSKSYCDSILKYDSKNKFAKKFIDKIDLTLSANELNMNHKIQLFDLLSGFPAYMGFADDPIEYAYDDAISELLETKEIVFQKGPLGQSKIPSIVIRKNCDDEMFEIANQIIIENTTHYIIPKHEIESIIGPENANALIDGNIDESFLDAISEKLNVNKIGIFEMNDLDVINNRIWYVQSSFYAYSQDSGFTQTIFTRGFNHDKRDLSIINIILLLLESLIFISIISFIDQQQKIRKIFNDNIAKSVKTKKFFELFINKIIFVSTCFVIPLVFSFVMIYTVSSIIPGPEDDFREASSRLWLLSLTLGMSIFPTLLNLILVNRLDLDGFHTIKGYRLFFNTSLYTTYFPIFIFYIIKFNSIPRLEHLLLILVTFSVSWLLSRSYYQFTANSIHKNLKTQATIGLLMGVLSLFALNIFILSNLTSINLFYGLVIAIGLALINELFDKRIIKNNLKKEKLSSKQNLIEDQIFIHQVIDPEEKIYKKIKISMDDDSLNIMILVAPMGIGKTVSLERAKKLFETNKDWDYYYGDCDEIQDEGAISFEPFLEAFGKLLNIDKFSNRGDNIESMKDSTVAAAGLLGVNTDIVTDFERDQQKSMTETCIEIVEKLENVDKKMVFVLEDLHWIDPETYSFLKHFIEIINNNEFLRKSICIVLTLRNGNNSEYRGINESKLREDLNYINEKEDFKFDVEELYDFKKSVKLKDFIKYLSDQDNAFKIQSYSMNQINSLFNNKLLEVDLKFILTPLYIRKTLEGWIEDGTLKYSPDGYLLTRTLNEDDLPNSNEVDKYYHSIFDTYEEKWQRLLESAAIIGNRFDAEILAKVWGFEFLDILSFLEKAVKDDLLEDLSAEDNMYKFTDKRIVSAIKSYFKISDKSEGDKQIVIEYNKRYIALQEEIIENPNKFSIEDLLKVSRRLATLIANKKYKGQLQKLIIEISVRLIIKKEFNKIRAFSDFLESKGLENISFILNVLSVVSDPDQDDNICWEEIKKIHSYNNTEENNKLLKIFTNDDFEKELILISCIYFNTSRLSKEEFNFLISPIYEKYKESVLFELALKWDMGHKKRSIKFEGFDETLDNLKDSADIEFYKLKVEILKIEEKRNFIKSKFNNTWSDKYPEPSINEIENEYLSLKEKVVNFNNLELTFQFLDSYIVFLSNQIYRSKDAIKLFNEFIHLFEQNRNFIREEIELKMLILSIFCRDLFIKDHKNLAQTYFEDVKSYFMKRFTSNTYNDFILKFFEFKINYLKEVGDFKQMLIECKLQLDIINKNKNNKSHDYAHACSDYGTALRLNGKGKESIKWNEKRISIQKKLVKKEDYTIFRTAYNNLALDIIEFDKKNYKKVKEYGKIALDLASSDAAYYYHSLHTYAFCLNHIGEFEESYKFFEESMKYLKESSIDRKEKQILRQNSQSVRVLSKFDLKKAIPKLKDALDKLLKSKYSEEYNDEIKKCKKILKDNS